MPQKSGLHTLKMKPKPVHAVNKFNCKQTKSILAIENGNYNNSIIIMQITVTCDWN